MVLEQLFAQCRTRSRKCSISSL